MIKPWLHVIELVLQRDQAPLRRRERIDVLPWRQTANEMVRPSMLPGTSHQLRNAFFVTRVTQE